MSSLRSSRGYNSVTVDRLRLTNTSGSPQTGVLTLSDTGVVGATGTVDINQLTVSGNTILNNTTAVSVAATNLSGGNVTVTNTLTAGAISAGPITGSTGTFATINGGTVVGTTGTYNSLTSGTVIGATGTFTTINGGPASFNGNVSVLGVDSGRGTTTTDYLSLISHDDNVTATPIWVQNNTLKWNNAQSQTVDILGAAKQMIPGTNSEFEELIQTDDITVLRGNFNRLIQILSANHAFVTYKPHVYIEMPIQTPQAVTFVAYPTPNPSTEKPTLVSSVTVTFPENPVQTVEAIVLALDSVFTSNGFPLSATLSSGRVTLTPDPGYSFKWQDGGSIASGFRFSSHIGLGGIPAYAAYNTPQTGSDMVANPIVQPLPPAAPARPTLVEAATPTTFTVSVPSLGIGFSAILYLDGKPIVAIDNSSSPVTWQHTFTGLLPTTTYSITATYVNVYDEGPLSPPLSVTTTAHTTQSIDLFSPAYAQYVTKTPYTGPALNGTYVQVLAINPGFWPTGLTDVSQINVITLQFKSAVNWDSMSIADARLVLLDKSGPTPTEKAVIYYAYQNRVTVTGSTLTWVGSPDPVPSQGPTNAPANAETISTPARLQAFFCSGSSTTIDKSKPLLFNWFCGYPGLNISNSDVTSFIINYTT